MQWQWEGNGLANSNYLSNSQQIAGNLQSQGLAATSSYATQLAKNEVIADERAMKEIEAMKESQLRSTLAQADIQESRRQGLAFANEVDSNMNNQEVLGLARSMLSDKPTITNGMSRAERNRANYNYGNAKNMDGTDKVFNSPEEGSAYIADRIARYHTDPRRQAKTLLDFTSIYAPSSDGNNPNGYAKFLASRMSKALGKNVGINDRIDFLDSNIVASMIPAIIDMEHGNGKVKLTPEQALMAANMGLSKYRKSA